MAAGPAAAVGSERAHGLFAGVSSYDISLEKQEVLVKGTIPYDDLKAKIAKTGKEVRISVEFARLVVCCGRLIGRPRSSLEKRLREGAAANVARPQTRRSSAVLRGSEGRHCRLRGTWKQGWGRRVLI